MRVAIVGAGPSGLVALKALRAEGSAFTHIKIFERRSTVGGAWNYQAHATSDSTIHASQSDGGCNMDGLSPSSRNSHEVKVQASRSWVTPMYADLHTNTPRDLMTFADHAFPPGTDQFPSRQEVMDYLASYAADVLEHIDFGRDVISITKDKGSRQWTVHSQSSIPTDSSLQREEFDKIVVASGHYDEPRIPQIEGLAAYHDKYPDRIRHSKFYRMPSPYADKRVLVIGTGPSGSDIATQIATVAKTPVWQSSRSTATVSPDSSPSTTANVVAVPGIAKLNIDGSVGLTDGTLLDDIDAILFCTGYLYRFPFLHTQASHTKLLRLGNGEALRNLHRHLLYIPDPSIAFIGMGQSKWPQESHRYFWSPGANLSLEIIPFPFAEAQSCYLARVWAGRIALPATKVMVHEENEYARHRGTGVEFMVFAHPEDGQYIDWLRTQCIESDEKYRQTGKLPVDWLNSDRWNLRATTKNLKEEWVRNRSRK